jgi:hypothetical protein
MTSYQVFQYGLITSETSVNIYQTTRRTIPEGSHLHSLRRESPKSQLLCFDSRTW